ncbi:methyltransferase family protein [Motilibacter rhizosphaerae]|uniref:Methyltransferase family protein n=1 Tax=Motilibacter rhizosphaerae TaxID=598652 RepID=A0A4V2F2V0_9ACTN|nr:class I SAM-dependent methyltransferase [Motilibacter rhizosphaerae]RZS80164.1 methyltransferase family protein [Motilibacter rhizosphaerae]
MTEENLWTRRLRESPGHSEWYVERFRRLAAEGEDVVGEARLVDAMLPRHARVLDAGCGTGRVGGHLARAGHTVIGVDGDAVLVAAAQEDHPEGQWLVGDLAELDLPALGISAGFAAIVCAGNVAAFLAPSTRVEVLRRLRDHLADDGRLVVGFGAGRGYAFEEFRADGREAGLREELLLSTWDLRPYSPSADFLVAVLGR